MPPIWIVLCLKVVLHSGQRVGLDHLSKGHFHLLALFRQFLDHRFSSNCQLPKQSGHSHEYLQKFRHPFSQREAGRPSNTSTFLGVVFDTAAKEITLPDNKLQQIHQELVTSLGKRRYKYNILLLVGLS